MEITFINLICKAGYPSHCSTWAATCGTTSKAPEGLWHYKKCKKIKNKSSIDLYYIAFISPHNISGTIKPSEIDRSKFPFVSRFRHLVLNILTSATQFLRKIRDKRVGQMWVGDLRFLYRYIVTDHQITM